MSLKKILNNEIKNAYPRIVSFNRIIEISKLKGHKDKTAERVLNKSLSPDVETIHNEKGQISGYRYIPLNEPTEEPKKLIQDNFLSLSRYY